MRAKTPEDVRVLRYVRLGTGDGSEDLHFIAFEHNGAKFAFRVEMGSSIKHDPVGTGPNAERLMDLAVENAIRDVSGHETKELAVVTDQMDSKGQKVLEFLFHPLFGADWSKVVPEETTVEDAEAESFHEVLKRQVKDWKGSFSGFRAAGHRYWPTFKEMLVKAVKAKYGSKLKLYRGVYGSYAGDILRGEPLKIRRLTAWSLDPNEALDFAHHGSGGGAGGFRKDYWLVIQATYPAEDVVAAPVTLPDYAPDPDVYDAFTWEKEVVIEDKRGALSKGSYKIVRRSRKKLAEWVAFRYAAIRKDRGYCICLPSDGLLYVDVPTAAHLGNLLLTQRFRGQAHFRTKHGHTPYSGGGIAFKYRPLLMRGVKPIWYPKGDHDAAVTQLVEDGVYADEREAQQYHAQSGYASECEWMGPAGLRFDPSWIVFAWQNPRKPLADVHLTAIEESLPNLDLRAEAPESGSSPCK
jgi:hypothetical protein